MGFFAFWGIIKEKICRGGSGSFSDKINSKKLSKKSPYFISSAFVCRAFEKRRIYIEVIPCKVTDVEGKPFEHASNICGSEYDSCGYESLYNAIIDSENIGLRLIIDVKPEDLLFVFGKREQSLLDALIEFPFYPPAFDPLCKFNGNCDNDECRGKQKYDAKPRAIILCKIKNTYDLESFFGTKNQKCRSDTNRYEITWSELQKIKNRLEDIANHDEASGLKGIAL